MKFMKLSKVTFFITHQFHLYSQNHNIIVTQWRKSQGTGS